MRWGGILNGNSDIDFSISLGFITGTIFVGGIMKKETRLEKRLREEAEAEAALKLEFEYYSDNWLRSLMSVFERMRQYDFELYSSDGKFNVTSSEYDFFEIYPITITYNNFNYMKYTFDRLTDILDELDRTRREAELKRELRANALDKLTREEKEVLGLI